MGPLILSDDDCRVITHDKGDDNEVEDFDARARKVAG
jgi:hypothetical protein